MKAISIKKVNNKSVNEYIEEQKGYIFIKVIIYIMELILVSFLVYKSSVDNLIPLPFIFSIALFMFFLGDLKRYKYIKKFNKYITLNKLNSKMGKCLYWNEYDFLLTEEFMFVITNKNVEHFLYSDIKEVYDDIDYISTGHIDCRPREFRHINILLFNGKTYRLLMYEEINGSTTIIKDIIPILLEKNNKIKVAETKKL